MDIAAALNLAAPELWLTGAVLVLLVLGAFMSDKGVGVVAGLAAGALLVAAGLAAVSPHGVAFNGGFVADRAAAYAKVAIYGFSAVGVLLGDRWLLRQNNRKFEYPILLLIAALGMGMMASAGDLISLYVGVELQSLALYVMAAFQRDDAKASEAGLKYFVLGALSSGLLLYGASLIYGFAGSTQFDVIAAAVQGSGAQTGVLFGLVFLVCGLVFKVGAAPFHMWTPDVYEGAPTPVVAFFAAAPKLAAMVLLARVLAEGFQGAADQWKQVIAAVAVISYIVGAYAGLAQRNLKRLLAYSSIANMGYALTGLAAGTVDGYQAVLVFMVLYMADTTGMFACLLALNRAGRPLETVADLRGLSKSSPGVALVLTLLSFSLMGIPPFSGFWAKFYVFKAAIASGLWPLAAVGLVFSVVAAFYYLRLIKTMWFDAPEGAAPDAASGEARGVAYAAAAFSFPVVLLALTVLDPAARAAAEGLLNPAPRVASAAAVPAQGG